MSTASNAGSPDASSSSSSTSTCSASTRPAFASLVSSTFGSESRTRCAIPSSPYSTDIESRIAPAFQVPKKAAAVSGVGGSSIATRSPRSTPWARRTFAKRFDHSWSSPQRTSRTAPSKSSWIIASLSGGCLSQQSAAML